MTQDLSRSKLVLWVLDQQLVYNKITASFFSAFSDFIVLKRFVYQEQVKGTVWEQDRFFGNASLVKKWVTKAPSYANLVRLSRPVLQCIYATEEPLSNGNDSACSAQLKWRPSWHVHRVANLVIGFEFMQETASA